MRLPRRILACAGLCLALAACEQSVMVRPATTDAPPPRSRPEATSTAPVHTVAQGDTLYKISVQYGLDYRDIAGWNGIAAPYTIYPKQRLRLGPPGGAAPESASAANSTLARVDEPAASGPATPADVGTGEALAASSPAGRNPATPTRPAAPGYDSNLGVTLPEGAQPLSSSAPTPANSTPVFEPAQSTDAAGAANATSPAGAATSAAATGVSAASDLPDVDTLAPARPQSSPTLAPLDSPGASVTPTRPTAAAGAGDVSSDKPSAAGWIWPTPGKVVGTYMTGDPTRQGVDIAGQSGQPVRAARDGEVVYSGAGLIGYGELIIIKHSPELLSAYGHNRVRLVKEGQKVKAGQKIAEMGRNPANRELLHFEIRRNGKPVDPQPLLPAR